MVSFRRVMPRLYELKDRADPNDPNAYFQNFEESLLSNRSALEAFLQLERQLSVLDDDAWGNLEDRATPLLQVREAGRGWQALFDILNEAKGYAYLRRIGCENVRFIADVVRKAPDLEGLLDGKIVLCEVKTINITNEEAQKRNRVHAGEAVSSNVAVSLSERFFKKLESKVDDASQQLISYDPHAKARRIAFLVVHFDDWVGDYQPEYFAQIDDHLLAHPTNQVELVVCPASNLFDRRFNMRGATVVEL